MSDPQITVTLPDGSQRHYAAGTTIKDVALSIGPKLGRDAVGGVVDQGDGPGDVIDVFTPLKTDCKLKIVTVKSDAGLEVLRHSASHVMASAVQRLFPGTQVTFGPAVDNGFYYDFKRDQGFTPEDLEVIEAEMKKIVAADLPFVRREVSRDEAKAFFAGLGETFKVEHLGSIPQGETITTYSHGDWTDLCRGPHVPSTGLIKAFKLTSVAGAYWKGDERNPMLARVYGTAFWDEKALEAHLSHIEEAKKRDHRKLGRELDLFSFHPVAPAMPFFHAKGAFIYNQLIELIRRYYQVLGFDEVITPMIVDMELFKRSGHYDHYRDNMFLCDVDEREFGVKPMNCPGHTLIYATQKRSYRELPIRIADFCRLHRYERSGVTAGLTRVRSFAQDDAHIFCREDQIPMEIGVQIAMMKDIFGHFGMESQVGFATRPAQSLGREVGLSTAERESWDAVWSRAEGVLKEVLDGEKLSYSTHPGDGAFYGPKIDFRVKDALDRWHQLSTVQLDFGLPRRFDLSYVNAEGGESRPVMIHRAMLGSLERFIGVLIEHTAGDFPLWLAPVQARIIAVTDELLPYAEEVRQLMLARGLRVRTDHRSEKLGFKIRDAEIHKIPVVMVVGKKELEARSVSLRWRKRGDLGTQSLDQAIALMLQAAAAPSPGEALTRRMQDVQRL
ncbi:MAG: threonine--tRNA ligase [Deltaproteobacteria bacterium]|nr:threonine--tRNA ligase [Deltaproteobacteria bacterium]